MEEFIMKRDLKKIISQMTLEEKAGMCSGLDFWHLKSVERLGIPEVMEALFTASVIWVMWHLSFLEEGKAYSRQSMKMKWQMFPFMN